MTVSVTLSERMFAHANQHKDVLRFVSVQIHDGEGGMISLYVDPQHVGKAMDMLQRVLDELDAMPAFDGPGFAADAKSHSTLDADHASLIVPAAVAAPQAIDGGEDCPF